LDVACFIAKPNKKNVMRKFSKTGICFSLIAAIFAVSCQNEENETIREDEALGRSAPLTALLQRVSMVDVSSDNIIDSTSCFKVKLPADVVVNNQPVHIGSEEDFATVQQILDTTDPVEVSVDLVFPVTVIFADGQESVLQNQEIMDAIVSDCEFGYPNPQPINCISINYPITIFGYDANLQLASTHVIQNNQQLFALLANLQSNQFYAIDFPISIINTDGQTISITNNNELQAAISQTICTPIDPQCPNPNILTDGLVVYMPFGNELHNLTHRGTPTITGNYHYVTDRDGNANGAISFDDGSNNAENSISIQLNANDDIMKNNNFTFSVWVKRQDNSGANPAEQIINNLSFSLFMGNNQDAEIMGPMLVFGNNIDNPMFDPSWINQGLGKDIMNWHHIVVSYDAGINLIRLYRNGVLTAALSPSGMSETIPSLIFANRYKGYMDDIRVYNKKLTDAEVHMLHQLDGDIYTCMN
jgi:hypothetical protein